MHTANNSLVKITVGHKTVLMTALWPPKNISKPTLWKESNNTNHNLNIGNALSDRQQNVVVDEGTVQQEFTVSNTGSNLATNEILVNVKTLEGCFNERIDRELGNIVDTVEDRIQNAILTAIDNVFAPRNESAVR